jgi:hypothetical protein
MSFFKVCPGALREKLFFNSNLTFTLLKAFPAFNSLFNFPQFYNGFSVKLLQSRVIIN